MQDPVARQEAVRNFRFGLIAPVVTRAAPPAERHAMLREVAKGKYPTPWGQLEPRFPRPWVPAGNREPAPPRSRRYAGVGDGAVSNIDD